MEARLARTGTQESVKATSRMSPAALWARPRRLMHRAASSSDPLTKKISAIGRSGAEWDGASTSSRTLTASNSNSSDRPAPATSRAWRRAALEAVADISYAQRQTSANAVRRRLNAGLRC